MGMKKFKYPLKDSNQFIEVSLVYVIKTSEETHHEFIVTEELLKEFNLSVEKFSNYLKHNLDKNDPSYNSAAELWASNRCFAKKKFSITRPTKRDQIIKIISFIGTEYIDMQQPELNLKQPRGSK
tara:strand:+ start:2819 stop:3193 length:375 start_codon:yes stop_codon:yes gene_type:complete